MLSYMCIICKCKFVEKNAWGGGRAGEGERDMLLNKYMYRGLNMFLYMCIPSKCKFRKKFIKNIVYLKCL